MQNTANRKGYLAFSITVTSTAAKLVDLVLTQLAIRLAGSYREVQIQVDPESSDSLMLRIGDGSLGTTVAGVVQKGVTLQGGGSDTYRDAPPNGIYVNMMYVQAVSDDVVINVQLLEA